MKDDTVSRAAVMQSLTKEYNRRRTGDGLKLAWIEKAVNDVPAEESTDTVKSHSEKQILEGCIALIDEMVGYFREYLDFIDFTPEYDEEKQPFCMSYFHIVNRLFLWHTSHCGGTSTRAKCYELGIDDSSKTVKFELWEDEEEDGEEEQHGSD